ncbi:MAG: hypothetical protein OXF01_17320, partial [Gemmatimonadetes bacterium]|nr:hypothetical protein [Gemmatimonadota bacterium]
TPITRRPRPGLPTAPAAPPWARAETTTSLTASPSAPAAADLVGGPRPAAPGHAPRHFCFHPPDTASVFVGDLILGDGDTTWIGEYRGAVADYLRSLDRLATLAARTLHPAHGPPIHDPAPAIARFRAHRLERVEQVRRAVADGHAGAPAIARHVYGPLPPKIRTMAEAGVDAILDYLSGAE